MLGVLIIDNNKSFLTNKINLEDLDLTGNNFCDGDFISELKLSDYDWMNYILEATFKTKKGDIFNIKFDYFGSTTSLMIVKILNKDLDFSYEYPTDIFKDNIVKYMRKHIDSWNSGYAFFGAEEVLNFYNEVIEKGAVRI